MLHNIPHSARNSWIRRALLFGLSAAICVSGCITPRPPSSAYPGLYSITTGIQRSPEIAARRPVFDDFKAIAHQLSAVCGRDTSHVVQMEWQELKSIPHVLPLGMPGGILLTKDGWGIDESEVANIEWKFYQQQLIAGGAVAQATQLAAEALPMADYFTNPFYDYYPVVGVSYEQVVAFCKWRGRIITQMINRDKPGSPDSLAADHIVVDSRLPTEAEWEQAALAKRGLPYGRRCTEGPVKVEPKAAAYLKQRSGSTESLEKITADIKAYNRTKPERNFINYNQTEPAFLQLKTPAYVFQGPPNDYQLFQLLGNAAELVQERGITKGGSYRDPLTACTTTARGIYTGPAPTIGFRCVSRAMTPNKR